MDSAGDLFVADSSGYSIRHITSSGMHHIFDFFLFRCLFLKFHIGVVSTIVAGGSFYPLGLDIDASGNLFVTNSEHKVVMLRAR